MKTLTRIALVGDFCSDIVAHQAIPHSLQLAANALNTEVTAEWLPTESVTSTAVLAPFDAIWVVPGSPYLNDDGAFLAITYARENNVPFLGSCAGFQYAVVEYARNVMGWRDAAHAETETTGRIVISPLSCSLVEQTGDIIIDPDTVIARAYGRLTTHEGYHCNFGMNADFIAELRDFPLVISAWDSEGDVRGIELPQHKYFVATLFQSERAALRNELSPLVVELIKAAQG
ncbi:CTP synthase C-terminal region-related (seleno)protein [Erwinia mallotivora]|uniref:CTP synthase (glutamine hydrolyzing) n=1 Tax=Erwinia mallotivora TaxID=69222 RepID=A0A014M9Z2_9GAMM|nr:CTP synthase [Erwinia mallotivora]EXU74904.1 hypothetical protein BG55_14370 [Erwinia mallotivora]